MSEVSNSEAQKRPWYKKKRFIIPIATLILLSALTSTSEEVTTTSSSESSESQQASQSENTEKPSEFGFYSSEQEEFLRIIDVARDEYSNAENELQESVILRKRDKDLCSLMKNKVVENWTGKITEIGANGEGKAHVEIELGENVRVKTWNNAVSDLGDNTLISPTSSFFDELTAISEDSVVTWSGRFLTGNSFCLKKANLTNIFYASDPQFIVKFTDIRKSRE